MYVYVYVYVYNTHTHTHKHTHTRPKILCRKWKALLQPRLSRMLQRHISEGTCVYEFMYACLCNTVYVYVSTCTWGMGQQLTGEDPCLCACMCLHTYMHVCVCGSYIYIYIYIYIYTDTVYCFFDEFMNELLLCVWTWMCLYVCILGVP